MKIYTMTIVVNLIRNQINTHSKIYLNLLHKIIRINNQITTIQINIILINTILINTAISMRTQPKNKTMFLLLHITTQPSPLNHHIKIKTIDFLAITTILKANTLRGSLKSIILEQIIHRK